MGNEARAGDTEKKEKVAERKAVTHVQCVDRNSNLRKQQQWRSSGRWGEINEKTTSHGAEIDFKTIAKL